MSYLVLARKYRPQSFDSVVGQEHITNAIENAILRDKVPHAFLFCGPRGVGKTTTARLLARALNCTGRELPSPSTDEEESKLRAQVEPCGECSNCREISSGSSLAVWEIDGASNNSVDNIRELIDSMRSAPPPSCKYKIYIIDEVHMLSTSAFNALLKNLEEPPPNTIFIFATTEPHKIPETVLSRCQRYDFRRLSVSAIIEQLEHICQAENIDAERESLEIIARRSNGGMRDAQSMLDRIVAYAAGKVEVGVVEQVFGIVGSQLFRELAECVVESDGSKCFELLDSVYSRSIDNKLFLDDLLSFWRGVLLVSTIRESRGEEAVRQYLSRAEELSESNIDDLISISEKLSSFDAERLFLTIEETVQRALSSQHPRYVVEAGLIRMSSLPSLKPVAELIESFKNSNGGLPLEEDKKKDQIKSEVKSVEPDSSKSLSEQIENFNPSWEAFIGHVKGRSEFVLAAFLRRVSPKAFIAGTLDLQGLSFDLESLKNQDTITTLKECLHSYSGHSEWSISFTEIANGSESGGEASDPAPDSLAAEEVKRVQARRRKVVDEAKQQDAVKKALEVFGGSSVDKIAVLDKS